MRSKITLISCFCFYLFSTACWGQIDFPKDTSFTVHSAWIKVKKKFDHALPVKPFQYSDIVALQEQVYKVRDSRSLHMDLFIPVNKRKIKGTVLLVHGGGWRSGNKSHLVPLAQYLAKNNYVAATVEHRLSMEAQYPAAIYDLKEAVKYVKHNAELFGVDTSKVAILGCSSGATLASFVATTNGVRKFEDSNTTFSDVSSEVHLLINIDGVVDFTDPAESGKDLNPEKPSAGAMFLGATYKQNPELWQEASPISHVDENTPPTLFLNSSLERFHAGRETFLQVLDSNKTTYKVHTIDNTPHPFWLFYPWFDEAKVAVLDFLNEMFDKHSK